MAPGQIAEEGETSPASAFPSTNDPNVTSENVTAQQDNLEFIALKRLAEQVRHNLNKLDKTVWKSMSPTLVHDLGLHEIVSVTNNIIDRIKEQQDKHPSSYLPGASGEVALPEPKLIMVDSRDAMTAMLISMAEGLQPRDGAADLSVDLEGYHLSADGTISLVQIFVHALNTVYLVHVAVLEATAFFTAATPERGPFSGTEVTLKATLEDNSIKKLFWDCRCDAQALYHLYGVTLAGVTNVQLCDVATREKPKERAKVKTMSLAVTQRLAKVLSPAAIKSLTLVKQAGIMTHACHTYEEAEQWFLGQGGVLPEDTSSRRDSSAGPESSIRVLGKDTFAQSPLRPLMQVYAVNDVIVLPVLHDHYTTQHRYWNAEWEARVNEASANRLEEGRSREFKAWNAMAKNLAPAEWKDVKQIDRFATL